MQPNFNQENKYRKASRPSHNQYASSSTFTKYPLETTLEGFQKAFSESDYLVVSNTFRLKQISNQQDSNPLIFPLEAGHS